MPRRATTGLLLVVCAMGTGAVGCRTTNPSSAAPASTGTAELTLANLAALHVIVLPTYSVRVAPDLDWSSAIGQAREVEQSLDAEIAAALKERGLAQMWILPEAL